METGMETAAPGGVQAAAAAEAERAGASTEKGPDGQQAGPEPELISATARLEEQRKELERQKEELKREYLRIDTRRLLADSGLPDVLVENVMGKDLAETKKTVQAVKESFDQAVQRQVEKRLVGKTPQCGNDDGYGMERELSDQVRQSLW